MSRFPLDTLRPEQNGSYFSDDSFKCILLNESYFILIEISVNFVLVDKRLSLVEVMA